jgi:hypothetical protein
MTYILIGRRRVGQWGGWRQEVVVGDRRYMCVVEMGRRVRIPYKPIGKNIGHKWIGRVYNTDDGARFTWSELIPGTLGVHGLIELHVCPVCNAGVKQTRAWTWVKPAQFLAGAAPCVQEHSLHRTDPCGSCPLSTRRLESLDKCGLIWIGEKFYPTAADFMDEATRLGVSRRIPAIPRNFKLGETWVLVAHPKGVRLSPTDPRVTAEELEELQQVNLELMEAGEAQQYVIFRKGVITMFKPTAIEKIVTETQAKNAAAMEELAKKGISPVVVPDDDPDHQGSVHDAEEPQAALPLNGTGEEARP